ncbi:MAG: uroporphyrinogen-III synthase [Deltaproteobacteria bacterium]|nr:uroporphyrinogen-III synthase [Deltaproteobacteria bacterium]
MPSGGDLQGLRVLAFESRRAVEIAELIRRHGGEPVSAPSMREVPLDTSPEALEFLARLGTGGIDVVVLLTGVGTRALATALAPQCSRERLAELLRATCIVARGPKPVAALRELGLTPAVLVPEPNTWREILTTLDAQAPVAGRTVAVQEYGRSNPELLDGLRARGASVLRVPVYRWDYPEDPGPLREGVQRLAAGRVDLVLFTSARQVEHVLDTAAQLGCLDDLMRATAQVVYASIGPVCSEAMQAHGLPVDLEPEHPKMGHLVATIAQRGRAAALLKRGAAD